MSSNMEGNQYSYLSKADLDELLKDDPLGLNALTVSLLAGQGEHGEASQADAAAALASAPEPVPDLGPARDGLLAQVARLEARVLSVPAESPERAAIVEDACAVLELLRDRLSVQIDELEPQVRVKKEETPSPMKEETPSPMKEESPSPMKEESSSPR
ncbi:hypothetical protein PG984_010172 [Apiospora sp. TS-2023a]